MSCSREGFLDHFRAIYSKLDGTCTSCAVSQLHHTLHPSPLTHSSSVSLGIFAYNFNFLLSAMCFWFVLNFVELT